MISNIFKKKKIKYDSTSARKKLCRSYFGLLTSILHPIYMFGEVKKKICLYFGYELRHV